MSKESSAAVGQRYEFVQRASSAGGGQEDQYLRHDPMGQHGRDLGRFFKPILESRAIPSGGWRAGKTWRDRRSRRGSDDG